MPKNIMASRAYEIRHDDPSSTHSIDDKQPYTPATTSEPESKHRSLEQTLVPNIDNDAVEEYKTSDNRRQVGTISAIFLIFNRMVGTGIFATPSEILSLSGSVGLALFMWVAGMLIAFSGMLVYSTWNSAPAYPETAARKTTSNMFITNRSFWRRRCMLHLWCC
jgi:hypothetical protein